VELTKMYGQLAATNYDYIGIGLLTAAIYLILGLPIARLSRALEGKLAYMRV
jgi:polar amino acid transport system substrate-binding protein